MTAYQILRSKSNVFFTENGLTSTSANHVANLAKEYVMLKEHELSSMRFYQTTMAIIGSDKPETISYGKDKEFLVVIPDLLGKIAEANSLIAWFREAIKARTALMESIQRIEEPEWADIVGKTLPARIAEPNMLTEDEIVAEMPIKKRNRYYSLIAQSAAIGKFIHPNGLFANAREELAEKMNDPITVKGEGRDSLVYRYEPTCDPAFIESMFFRLQNLHRSLQSELNGIKHDIQTELEKDAMTKQAQYSEQVKQQAIVLSELETEFKDWKLKESEELTALRIVIPNELLDIYNEVSKLGK